VDRIQRAHKNGPKIENARDRSLWRFNLDHSQYSRCCVLRLPQWPPSSFRWRCYHWLRWLSELRLASGRCTPARPVANLPARIGFVSFGSTGCKPSTCVDCSALPLVLRRSIWLAPDDPGLIGLAPDNPGSTRLAPHGSFLRLGRQPTSDSHRCRPLARLAASSGLRLMLPLPLGWLRFRFAPAASPSALTVREPLGLRLVVPSPAEPVMHSLFQLNLASPAKPSMSILYPPALASSGIFQLNNFRLASAFALLVRPAIPLRLAPQVSPSVRVYGHRSGSHRLFAP
jgi:hypothetical protein